MFRFVTGVHFSIGDYGIKQKTSQPFFARYALEELIFLLRNLYREFVLRKSTCVESAQSDLQKHHVSVSLRSFSKYRTMMLTKEKGMMVAEKKLVIQPLWLVSQIPINVLQD